MKKTVIQCIGIILAAIMSLFLIVACTNDGGETLETDPSTVDATPTDAPTEAIRTRPITIITQAPTEEITIAPELTDAPVEEDTNSIHVGSDEGSWKDPVDMQ